MAITNDCHGKQNDELHQIKIKEKKENVIKIQEGKRGEKREKCGGEGFRSPCLAHAKRALYQLSYTPKHLFYLKVIFLKVTFLGKSFHSINPQTSVNSACFVFFACSAASFSPTNFFPHTPHFMVNLFCNKRIVRKLLKYFFQPYHVCELF